MRNDAASRGIQPDGSAPLVPMAEPIIGAAIAAKYPPGLAARLASEKPRTPCPVCGHPTGDCTGEH